MNFPPKQNLRVTASYCFKFHKGGHCHSCAYSHNNYCFKSDGNHRVNLCTFRHPSQPSALTPQAAGSPSSTNTDPIAPSLSLETPINPERLEHLLAGYEPTITEFLFHGFKNGFLSTLKGFIFPVTPII